MTNPSEALVFANNADGKTLTAEQVRFFIVNSYDTEGLRSVAYDLLEGLGRMHRSQMEYRTKVGQRQREIQERFSQYLATLRSATPTPSPAPIVKFEPGAIALTVSPPSINFEAGAVAVDVQRPLTGMTVERDAKGNVIGVTPKPTP